MANLMTGPTLQEISGKLIQMLVPEAAFINIIIEIIITVEPALNPI